MTTYGVTTDYEYSAEHKRQKLDIWEGPFFSSWTGTAYSLPNGAGFMVTTYNDGAKVRVSCPSPRTADNYLEVDAALSEALNEYFEKAGFAYVGSPYGSEVDMTSQLRETATD